jgi:hypothetical protein
MFRRKHCHSKQAHVPSFTQAQAPGFHTCIFDLQPRIHPRKLGSKLGTRSPTSDATSRPIVPHCLYTTSSLPLHKDWSYIVTTRRGLVRNQAPAKIAFPDISMTQKRAGQSTYKARSTTRGKCWIWHPMGDQQDGDLLLHGTQHWAPLVVPEMFSRKSSI